jgi:hypothetical protein
MFDMTTSPKTGFDHDQRPLAVTAVTLRNGRSRIGLTTAPNVHQMFSHAGRDPPIRQIAENSGVEGSIVVGKVLENKSQSYGFDAQTEQYVDMAERRYR